MTISDAYFRNRTLAQGITVTMALGGLTGVKGTPKMKPEAVLGGELAVPCTRNPL